MFNIGYKGAEGDASFCATSKKKLKAYFTPEISTYHKKLSETERVE